MFGREFALSHIHDFDAHEFGAHDCFKTGEQCDVYSSRHICRSCRLWPGFHLGHDVLIPAHRSGECRLVISKMFAVNLIFVWLCARELFHPRTIARWMETSTSLKLIRIPVRKIRLL